jgi:diguanylate cyclase (GGDEF)-like protein/PAS domain S-box-containing protein
LWPLPRDEAVVGSTDPLRTAGFDESLVATALLDIEGRFVDVNQAYVEWLGYSREELLSLSFLIVIDPADVEAAEAASAKLASGAIRSYRTERRHRRADGTLVWGLVSVVAVLADGGDKRLVVQVMDITEVKRSETELREARQRFEQAFERAPIGMALVDLDGRFMRVNQALCTITGYDADQLVSKSFQEITHPDDLDKDVGYARQLLAGEIRYYQIEKRYIRPDGGYIWVNLSGTLVRDAGDQPDHFIAQVQDISERKRLEARLRNLADHDSLTGLRNRRVFEEALIVQVGRCQRYGEQAALLMIDLDGFKLINDTHGHRAGDRTLKAVAAAITQRIRSNDIVARLGGDEFAVLLLHIDADLAAIVAQQIQTAIAAVTMHDGHAEIDVGASIGLALIDQQTVDDQTLLSEADRAMYRAKAQARELAPMRE